MIIISLGIIQYPITNNKHTQSTYKQKVFFFPHFFCETDTLLTQTYVCKLYFRCVAVLADLHIEHVSILLYHLVSKKQNAGLLCSITQTFSLCMWMYIHNLCEQTNYRLRLRGSYRWKSALCAQNWKQHSWFSNPPTLDRKRIDSSDITGSVLHT